MRKTRIPVPCALCGLLVERQPSELAKNKRTFCSYDCMNSFRRTGTITAGYLKIRRNGPPKLEHRRIVEEHLGRQLSATEYVHHKNGDKLDNRLENLEVMSPITHSEEHHPLTWDFDKALAMSNAGISHSDIAKHFGVSQPAISHTFRKRGYSKHLR